jgi:hypothetical protein
VEYSKQVKAALLAWLWNLIVSAWPPGVSESVSGESQEMPCQDTRFAPFYLLSDTAGHNVSKNNP